MVNKDDVMVKAEVSGMKKPYFEDAVKTTLKAGGTMRRWRVAVLELAFFALAGCLAGVYYTNVPPPPDRVEVVGAAPAPEFVWISGYWTWRGDIHVWVPGSWVRPPRPGAIWIRPHWERRYGRYYFYQGHWQ